MENIKFLKPIKIKSVWEREDTNFTPWLAQEEPLRELFAECGLELGNEPLIRTEVKTPGSNMSLDILVETEFGLRVAIENQYSSANHDHLTRSLVYGIVLEADVILLVAEDHRPEFRQVANYLNGAALSYGKQGIPIYLVKVEVLSTDQVDTVYPRFEAVAEPDEWKAALSKAFLGDDPTASGLIYNYFDQLIPVLREKTGVFQNTRPNGAGNWINSSMGLAGLGLNIAVAQNRTSIQLYFGKQQSPELNHARLDVIAQYKAELHESLPNYQPEWRKTVLSGIVEVSVDEIGYKSDISEKALETVSNVAQQLEQHCQAHLTEIAAIKLNVADNEGGVPPREPTI